MIDRIVWDWNCTILDDLAISVESINTMLDARNMLTFGNVEEYYKHFRFPIESYYKSAGFDFEKEPYLKLLTSIGLYYGKLKNCTLAVGVTGRYGVF
jgi:phosphoglycolate phosphatase